MLSSPRRPDEGRAREPANRLDPVSFIEKEHAEQDRLCDRLAGIVDGPFGGQAHDGAFEARRYLAFDLPAHLADWDEDILPMLNARGTFRDRPQGELAHVSRMGAVAGALAPEVAAGLDDMASGRGPDDPARFILTVLVFVESLRERIGWETLVGLPCLRDETGEAERTALGVRMARRRAPDQPALRIVQ